MSGKLCAMVHDSWKIVRRGWCSWWCPCSRRQMTDSVDECISGTSTCTRTCTALCCALLVLRRKWHVTRYVAGWIPTRCGDLGMVPDPIYGSDFRRAAVYLMTFAAYILLVPDKEKRVERFSSRVRRQRTRRFGSVATRSSNALTVTSIAQTFHLR